MAGRRKSLTVSVLLFGGALRLGFPLDPAPVEGRVLGTLVYSDDFSTDKAKTDSYSHSAFVDRVPDIHLDGLLTFTSGPSGSRGITFYPGSEVYEDCHLAYRFPLSGDTLEITGGQLAIEYWPISWPSPLFQVSVAFDDASGGFTQALTLPGHRQIALSPPQPCHSVRIRFSGGPAFIDNLEVSLNTTTPVEAATWSAIKLFFR